MAQRRVGTVHDVHRLSDRVMTFRLAPAPGTTFPPYQPGQYLALSRDDSHLTRKVGVDEAGAAVFALDLDEDGRPRTGRVTHAYSIASAPFETQAHEYLEFFIVLEVDDRGLRGRLTDALFRMGPETSCEVAYLDRITGSFTLEARAPDAEHVVMVASGTGVAPFVSMLKQADHEAGTGHRSGPRRFTLLYTNRHRQELGYHETLTGIAESGTLDFTYVPTVSRPDGAPDPGVGTGRVNNVFRLALEHAPREPEPAVSVTLPGAVSRSALTARLRSPGTVVLTCGNPKAMDDVHTIATGDGLPYQTEKW